MVVANKKSKCLKRNNGWKSLSLLFVTDYHYLFLRNGLKVFYYEVETVEIIFETNHIGLVDWMKRKVLSAPLTYTDQQLW